MKLGDELKKGKGNGQRKAYDHITTTNAFGVADRIAEAKKSNRTRYNKRK